MEEIAPHSILGSVQVASRGSRLAAAVLDVLLYPTIPVAVWYIARLAPFGLGFGNTTALFLYVVAGVTYGITVAIVNWILIWRRSQTLGKHWLNIQVVHAVTGKRASFRRYVISRGFFAGGFVSLILTDVDSAVSSGTQVTYVLIDALFIFREDYRTLHDLIGGTRVATLPQRSWRRQFIDLTRIE
ncbi:RDD family protein [Candidatus Poribacteria bacterium]|nr:RDD family protein [Candidatus Poribacteria bacterium]